MGFLCGTVGVGLNLSFTEARILSSIYWLGEEQETTTLIHLFCPNCAPLSPNSWLLWHALNCPIPLELKYFKRPLHFSFFFSSQLFSLGNRVFTTTQTTRTYHCHRLSFVSLLFCLWDYSLVLMIIKYIWSCAITSSPEFIRSCRGFTGFPCVPAGMLKLIYQFHPVQQKTCVILRHHKVQLYF